MTHLTIWLAALALYAVFYCWYIGFRKKISLTEAQELINLYQHNEKMTDKQVQSLQSFFANDDGKDFVMVNLLHLKQPLKESRAKLGHYQKIFLGQLLRKAGHPVMIGRAASGNIENVACDQADDWTAFGMIRYRSRRDLMEMLVRTVNSEHHDMKLDSLEKTLAFPASPWSLVGGIKLLVPLVLALVAAAVNIALLV